MTPEGLLIFKAKGQWQCMAGISLTLLAFLTCFPVPTSQPSGRPTCCGSLSRPGGSPDVTGRFSFRKPHVARPRNQDLGERRGLAGGVIKAPASAEPSLGSGLLCHRRGLARPSHRPRVKRQLRHQGERNRDGDASSDRSKATREQGTGQPILAENLQFIFLLQAL